MLSFKRICVVFESLLQVYVNNKKSNMKLKTHIQSPYLKTNRNRNVKINHRKQCFDHYITAVKIRDFMTLG